MANTKEIIKSLARYNETNFTKYRIKNHYQTALGTLYQGELTTLRGKTS